MLTAQILLEKGFKGKRIGELIKLSKDWNPEQLEKFLQNGELPVSKVQIQSGSCWDWFINNPCVNGLLQSSNSQKRRWLEEGAVLFNGEKLGPDSLFPDKLDSLVFFPNSNLKITML